MVDIILREGNHPQTGPGTLTAAEDCVTMIDDGAANLSEGDSAICVAHRHNGKE
jgi:hypothetical protein